MENSQDLHASYVTDDETTPVHNPDTAPNQGGAALGTGQETRPPSVVIQAPGRKLPSPPPTNHVNIDALRQRFAPKAPPRGIPSAPRSVFFSDSVSNRLQAGMDDALEHHAPYDPYADASGNSYVAGDGYGNRIRQATLPYGPRQSMSDYAGRGGYPQSHQAASIAQINQTQPSGHQQLQKPNLTQSYQSHSQWSQASQQQALQPASQYANGAQVNQSQQPHRQAPTSTNPLGIASVPSISKEEMERIVKACLKELAKSKRSEDEREAAYATRRLETDRARMRLEPKTTFEAEWQSAQANRERKMAKDLDRQLELDRSRITAELKAELDLQLKLRDEAEQCLKTQLGEVGDERCRLQAELALTNLELEAQSDRQVAMTAESSAALGQLEAKLFVSEEKLVSEGHKKAEVESQRDVLQSKLSIWEEMFMSEADKSAGAKLECDWLQARLSLSEMMLASEAEQRLRAEKERDELRAELSLSEEKLRLETNQKESAESERNALQTEASLLKEKLILEADEKERIETEREKLRADISALVDKFALEADQRAKEAADLEQRLEQERALALSKLTVRFQEELKSTKETMESALATESRVRIAELQEGLLTSAKHLARESEQRQTEIKSRLAAEMELDQLQNGIAQWFRNTHPPQLRGNYDGFSRGYEGGSYEDEEAQGVQETANDHSRRGRRRERHQPPPLATWHPPPPGLVAPEPPSRYIKSSEAGESEASVVGDRSRRYRANGGFQQVGVRDEKNRRAAGDKNHQGSSARPGQYRGPLYTTSIHIPQTTSDSDGELLSDDQDSEPERRDVHGPTPADSAQRARRLEKPRGRAISKKIDKGPREKYSPVPVPGGAPEEEERMESGAKLVHDDDLLEPVPARPFRLRANKLATIEVNNQRSGVDMSPSAAAIPDEKLQVPSRGSSTSTGNKTSQTSQSGSKSSRQSIESPASTRGQNQQALVEAEHETEGDDEQEEHGQLSYGHGGTRPEFLLPYADQFGGPVYWVPNPHGRRARVTKSGRRVEEDEDGMIWGFRTRQGFVPLMEMPYDQLVIENVPMRRTRG
ncbi:hypothetical protein ACJ41O_009319 [Fusarium nematophilum]